VYISLLQQLTHCCLEKLGATSVAATNILLPLTVQIGVQLWHTHHWENRLVCTPAYGSTAVQCLWNLHLQMCNMYPWWPY